MAIEIMVPQDVDFRSKASEIVSRFRYAESHRKQYDRKAIEYYKQYIGHRDPPHIEGRSNIHIPRTYEQVDTIRSRIVKSFFNTRPYIEFLPRPQVGGDLFHMMQAEERAVVASALVDDQLHRNKIVAKFYDFVTSFLIFPAAILGVGWRYDEREVKQTVPVIFNPVEALMGMPPVLGEQMQTVRESVWDDNEITNVDFFDFWPDPLGHDLDSCRFVFQREVINLEQLFDRLSVLSEAGLGTTFPLSLEEITKAGSSIEFGRYERLGAVGVQTESQEGSWSDEDILTGRMVEVLHYWEDTKYALLINRTLLAYYGESPYWKHGKKPFVVSVFEPLPNEFYGLSAVHLIYHLQEELNTNRNQRIDNVSLILNRMWKVRRSADIDESELVSRPHGIIHVEQPDDVQELALQDVPHSTFMDEQIIKQDMEGTLGTPSVVRGADPVRRETATEIVTKSSSAGVRFDVKILLFEALGFSRLAELMDLNNQQFISGERVVRLFGEDSAQQWAVATSETITGEWDYSPSGANVDPAANKEFRRQQLGELMAVVFGTNNPFVDKYVLTKMWLESFDIRNVRKALLPREYVEAMQQAAMQHEQVIAGRVPAPGEEPPGHVGPDGTPIPYRQTVSPAI